MKQCPQCKKTYTDDLSFCLEDGSVLSLISFSDYHETPTVYQEIPTVILSNQRNSTQLPVNQPAKWIYPVVGVMSALIIILGFLAALPYLTAKKEGSDETNSAKDGKVKPTQSETPSPTVQTIIRETPKTVSTPTFSPSPMVTSTTSSVATVNSPRDGYLVLRGAPCTAPCGTMLIKIPHGTRLSLGTCKDTVEVANKQRGQWCYTSYGGYSGWIFDAFVTRDY